ncbi:hypothetical protein cyc_00020 [Cyclospora cayetanensis]|uniref:Uncharacterized protein n=1 Tax=Cyclospora cayetanensis TaxID=88456 RepID=A0A1D3CSC8_9EIME|nr:hypothetical protein cyc_00020 [Cyclospora cayetanensis]
MAASEEPCMLLLDRVFRYQDVEAAAQLLRHWEQQRDTLLLTSWESWAAAVKVSVQQLQQVVLLVHGAAPPAKEQRCTQQKPDAADIRVKQSASHSDAAPSDTEGNKMTTGSYSCAGGVLSAAAYEVLLQLVRCEAALVLKGPQSPDLLHLHRPPSVKEWAAAAAADTEAQAAAKVAVAISRSPDQRNTGISLAAPSEQNILGENASLDIRAWRDLTATERQPRAALQEQLRALHSLVSWQQQHLAASAASVREEQNIKQQCKELSITPQKLRAVQIATSRPISTEAEIMGRTPDKGT